MSIRLACALAIVLLGVTGFWATTVVGTEAGIKTVNDDDLVKLFHSHSNFVVLFCKYCLII